MHFVTIDVQVILWDIGLIHTAERSNGRLGAILSQQGIDRFLQLFGPQRLTVFKFELEPACVTHTRYHRRNDAEHLRLLYHTVCLLVETIHHSLSRMFLTRAFLPVFQHHKVSGCIRKFTSTHYTEAIDSQKSLDFGILLQNCIYLLTHRFRTFQRRSRRKLNRHDKVTIIFFGHECAGPFHEKHQCNDRKHRKRADSHHRLSQQPFYGTVISTLHPVIETIECQKQLGFLLRCRFQKYSTKCRRKCQRIQSAQDRRCRNGQGKLLVKLPRNSTDQSGRNEYRQQDQYDPYNRTRNFSHGFLRNLPHVYLLAFSLRLIE